MLLTGIIIPVLTLVAIFLFGIQKFSKQIEQAAGPKLKNLLTASTKTPLRGIVSGTAFSALVHSSTATTVILVGLVSAGFISFSNSLGVILGANIGTTITAQLVALDVPNFSPYIVLLGFLITYLGRSYRHLGKSIFYFGLVFFSLSLISLYIEPVKSNPEIIRIFSELDSPQAAILAGLIFTAVIQSSGVASGLVIILVGAGLLDMQQAIGVILGANIGTTATALIASLGLNRVAKKTAVAHLLFNVIGVALFFPFIGNLADFSASLGGSTQQAVANAHLIFNLVSAVIFLIFLKPFERLINFIL